MNLIDQLEQAITTMAKYRSDMAMEAISIFHSKNLGNLRCYLMGAVRGTQHSERGNASIKVALNLCNELIEEIKKKAKEDGECTIRSGRNTSETPG